MSEKVTEVSLNNCSAPYNMRLSLEDDDEGVISKYAFKNFISARFILEGELKRNTTIEFEKFVGTFGKPIGHLEINGVIQCYNDNRHNANRSYISNSSTNKNDT